ncbi:type III-B CRISPR module RAMP protein Cmr4 [Fimbriiglobus ruber]|uniref:CRISPR-associated RAMP Cmr4 n=1 Tax=Fimbriiglobus ruber TaxID=1908690 RepID=A0A225DXP7_9BACT|nr:type III-B CRISPR module RAMP protein Cmr4 [Fimbriiglobus ruber]OWK41125.1 CRISPR-associated RAMP Cmr4 [Fimbriiglobus ruber]
MADAHEPIATGLLGLHALTALHPGAGTAPGQVDLPVQRERHTGWPNIAGSSLKGILRDTCREQISRDGDLDKLDRHDDKPAQLAERKGTAREKANNTLRLNELFGPPTAGSSEFAGAVSITDARLLAYPVRSLKGVFAWVTCPEAVERFARDTRMAGTSAPTIPPTKDLKPQEAMVPPGCPCLIDGKHLLLEEFRLAVVSGDPSPWATWVASHLLPTTPDYAATRARFAKHLVVAHDDDFTHFVKYATEVTARIGLDYETKTVKSGALFYQEFLPTESLFYSVVLVNRARTRRENGPAPSSGKALLANLTGMLQQVPVLQIGGDETTGKGYCSVRLNTGDK